MAYIRSKRHFGTKSSDCVRRIGFYAISAIFLPHNANWNSFVKPFKSPINEIV